MLDIKNSLGKLSKLYSPKSFNILCALVRDFHFKFVMPCIWYEYISPNDLAFLKVVLEPVLYFRLQSVVGFKVKCRNFRNMQGGVLVRTNGKIYRKVWQQQN